MQTLRKPLITMGRTSRMQTTSQVLEACLSLQHSRCTRISCAFCAHLYHLSQATASSSRRTVSDSLTRPKQLLQRSLHAIASAL